MFESAADTPHVAARPPSVRGKVTNGSALHADGVDNRSREARRFKDLYFEIVGDLGGADHLSEGQRQLARRCAMLSATCERMEAAAVAGEDFDLDAYGMLTDRLGRALTRLGLRRLPKDITPSLSLREIANRISADQFEASS